MNSKTNCEANAAPELPGFTFIPRIPKNRKEVILISSVLVLLTAVIIAAILIGVYITQEYTERIIKTISNGKDGETVESTMMVNNQERVAAFLIKTNKTSATVVYDYKRHLIGIRIHDQKQCSVVAMDSIDVPSLNEIAHKIEHFDEQVSESNSVVYSFKKGKLAVHTTLGTSINILCGDIPIYWAEEQDSYIVKLDQDSSAFSPPDDSIDAVVLHPMKVVIATSILQATPVQIVSHSSH